MSFGINIIKGYFKKLVNPIVRNREDRRGVILLTLEWELNHEKEIP